MLNLTGYPDAGQTNIFVLKHYKTKQDTWYNISEYLRTAQHSLNIKKYLARKFEHVLTNF